MYLCPVINHNLKQRKKMYYLANATICQNEILKSEIVNAVGEKKGKKVNNFSTYIIIRDGKGMWVMNVCNVSLCSSGPRKFFWDNELDKAIECFNLTVAGHKKMYPQF